MLFTALSYGLMAKHYPVAGSAYTYVRKSLDSAGFIVGWAILLDYLFLPLVIWLIGAAYLNGEFPNVPNWVWIIAQFTSGLAAQAAVARLLYAMGRDGVLPNRFFSMVWAKFHTPVLNSCSQA
jgi:amino acid transporter